LIGATTVHREAILYPHSVRSPRGLTKLICKCMNLRVPLITLERETDYNVVGLWNLRMKQDNIMDTHHARDVIDTVVRGCGMVVHRYIYR